jgi:hypothetical protein
VGKHRRDPSSPGWRQHWPELIDCADVKPDPKTTDFSGHRANRGVWFFWVCALLVTCESLHPFHYASPISLEFARDKFVGQGTVRSSPGDVAGNISLCLRLELFAGSLGAPRIGRRTGWRPVWVGCDEVAQMWNVGHTADITPFLPMLLLGYGVRAPNGRLTLAARAAGLTTLVRPVLRSAAC